ncbi:NAD-dependent epimerase/dehydratase family protein [Nocardia sp. NPDC056000]|uniref:NAD-dependent epimerase/dehydratase family protein n=1 Tax=Nocardia sp. NPDC056000 TaxID=3345674 RepID=UPI0035DDCFA8
MKVFLTGGTGAIGSHALPALVWAGHEVTALARTPEKAEWIRARGATPVILSLFDSDALATAFDEHDAVVNLATALPATWRWLSQRAWRRCTRIRVEGSTAVTAAAVRAGIPRLVQESVSMIYPDRGADWITEDLPVDHYPRAAGNIAAEANTDGYTAAGRTGVVLRFGVFCGPGAAHSAEMFALARRHVVIMTGPPDAYISTIHLADGAAAVVAALTVDAGTYNVVDDEPLTHRDYATALADAAGARPWLRGPGRATLLAGHRMTSTTRSLRVGNARFKSATGWSPRYPSAREAWRTFAH